MVKYSCIRIPLRTFMRSFWTITWPSNQNSRTNSVISSDKFYSQRRRRRTNVPGPAAAADFADAMACVDDVTSVSPSLEPVAMVSCIQVRNDGIKVCADGMLGAPQSLSKPCETIPARTRRVLAGNCDTVLLSSNSHITALPLSPCQYYTCQSLLSHYSTYIANYAFLVVQYLKLLFNHRSSSTGDSM